MSTNHVHTVALRGELSWHLHRVMSILLDADEHQGITEGVHPASIRLLHEVAYSISTEINGGVEPHMPPHLVEGILEDYCNEQEEH